MKAFGEPIKWQDCDREAAIIITNDGKIYEDINHQYCLQAFQKDYLSDYDLSDDSDLSEAIKLTDYLFKEGKFHGFDVFIGRNKRFFASHYERAFDNENVVKSALKYAKEHELMLTTFQRFSETKEIMKRVA